MSQDDRFPRIPPWLAGVDLELFARAAAASGISNHYGPSPARTYKKGDLLRVTLEGRTRLFIIMDVRTGPYGGSCELDTLEDWTMGK